MFQKLFGRKKTASKTQQVHSNSKPAAKLVVATPETIVEAIVQADGKKKQTLLAQLARMIDSDRSILDSVSGQLPELEKTMLALHFSALEPSNIVLEHLQHIACEGFNVSVRQIAANHIEDESTLHLIAQTVKTKDKSVYRIVKTKLDNLASQQKATEALLHKQQSVIQALQQLAKASHDPMLDAKYRGLLDQWTHCGDGCSEHVQQQFEQAKQQAEQRVKQEASENIIEAEPTPVPVELAEEKNSTPHVEHRVTLMNMLAKDLVGSIEAGEFSDEVIHHNQQFLAGIQRQWQESEQIDVPSEAEQKAFKKISTAYKNSLAKLTKLQAEYGDYDAIVELITKDGSSTLVDDLKQWLEEVSAVTGELTAAPIVNIKKALKAQQANLAKHRQQEIDHVRAIRGQIRRCQSAIDEGSIRRASGLYQGVEEKIVEFNFDNHPGLKKLLDDTTEALEKLRDWQSYAVLPKKEALIKKMEALVHQSVTPEQRAQSIKDMQDEWKQLSRGLQNRQQDLWQTFHSLAQQAYEPCKEFYSEQRHLRDVNLAKRKEVVEQLSQYDNMIDWSAPDLKELDRVLQAARNDWRHYSPVDRAASKTVQKQFDALHQKLYNQLLKEQTVFKERKQEIIERAKALLELDDLKKATTEAKQLQQEWKAAGIVARKDEQVLWKAFREVCDELFNKRDEQNELFKADLEANKLKATELIESLERLRNSDEPESEQSVFENLKAQYELIGTLPKDSYTELNKRYKAACDAFLGQVKAAKHASADAHWQSVFQWVKKARFSGMSSAELTELWQDIKVPTAAKPLVALQEQWQQPVDDLNRAAMHEKTLDIEILVGIDSPAEDASMRMNLQVQRLSDGIGYQVTEAEVHQSVVDWLSIGAVEKAAYDQFESRLLAARNQYLSKNIK